MNSLISQLIWRNSKGDVKNRINTSMDRYIARFSTNCQDI